MKKFEIFSLALLILICSVATPSWVVGGEEDFEKMEFLLDKVLKATDDPSQRVQILSRFVIKSMGLIYKQNNELLRLNREKIKILRNLLNEEKEEKEKLEFQIRELRNQMQHK